MFTTFKSQANAYSNIHMETGVLNADPHQLINLLLEGALGAIAAAHNAIESGDAAAKRRSIGRAVGIVEDGLRGALNHQGGGDVAKTLYDLYSCVLLRLTRANLNSDLDALRECRKLLTPLRDAWSEIRPSRIAA